MVVKVIVIVVGIIFTAAFGYGSYHYRRKLLDLRSVRMVEIADIDEGKSKTTGEVVVIEEMIRAPISGARCVWFSVAFQEEREVTQTYSEYDHARKRHVTKTRMRTEYVDIFSDAQFVAFNIQDGTGDAEIDMTSAEAIIKSKDRRTKGRVRELSGKALDRLAELYPKQPKILGKKCHYVEHVIEEGDTLLVMGEVTLSKKRPPLFAHEKKKPLLISDQSDEQLQKSFKTTSIWLGVAAGLFVVATILGGIFIGGK